MNSQIPAAVSYESLIETLEATGDFRVLRRLKPPEDPLPDYKEGLKSGLYVDVETTGLDPAQDEVIELAMVPFRFRKSDGHIVQIGKGWSALREPSKPIAPELTAIHGITNEMVVGKSIDPLKVAACLAGVDIVVAHNAAFDRPFLERFCETFAAKHFGCSMSEVDWKGEGFEGAKLAYLASECGFFYDKHRALNDCHAGLELLSRPLPKSGVVAFAKLLESARRPVVRLWAKDADIRYKDILKGRGYKWNDGKDGGLKAWSIALAPDKVDAERAFLWAEIFRREVKLPVLHLTALNRFSVRATISG